MYSPRPRGRGSVEALRTRRDRDPHGDPDALTTRDLYFGGTPADWPALTGEVLQSWAVTNVGTPWGLLLISNLWVSGVSFPITTRPDVYELTTAGAMTGVSRDTATNGAWVADMTYDSTHGLACQVNVGGTGVCVRTDDGVRYTFFPQCARYPRCMKTAGD